MSARRLPSSKLNAKSRIVHGVELVDCEQDAVQQVQHRTTGKKRSIPNDLQSTLFHEKVYEFRRRYPHVFIDQAPVFRWLVQFPNGSTMRYRTARELRDATGLSRAAFENLANGILPQQGEEENYPQIHAIFQTWNEAALPDSTAARQAYRETVIRGLPDQPRMPVVFWENLFLKGQIAAQKMAKRYPKSVRG
jgi:hypothetical protein